MNDSSQNTDEGLVRGIGIWALGASIINMVVGAGIFVLPGVVAAQIGPAALMAYLVCAVLVGLVFLCYAEVGSRVTRSGGSYAYVEDAFGPFAGFVVSTLLLLGFSVFSDAALAVAMTDALALTLVLFFAFGGAESALSASGEISNPSAGEAVGVGGLSAPAVTA